MRRLSPAVWLTLAGIAVATALLDWWMPLTGDDLEFQQFLLADDPRGPVRHAIAFVIASLMSCTGRLFDFAGPIMVWALPQWLTSAITGVMGAVYFYAVLRAARVPRHRPATALLTIVATLIVTPWWDSLWLRTCQYNYVWGAAFCLLFITSFISRPGRREPTLRTLALTLLAFLAGATHEQTGVAMTVTLAGFALWRGSWRGWTRTQWCMAVALGVGTLITISAPSIWHRAATESYHFPVVTLLVTTLPLFSVTVAAIAVCLCFAGSRRRVAAALGREGLFILIAACVAAVIAVASGVPGRTGLFPEACAVALIAKIAVAVTHPARRPVSAGVCLLCMAVIAVHYSVTVRAQRVAFEEHTRMERLYSASAYGVIHMDYTGRYDFSPLTLLRVKGVPDEDDANQRQRLRRFMRKDGRPLVILPEALQAATPLTGPVSAADVTIYPARPNMQTGRDSLMVQLRGSASPRIVTVTVTTPGDTLWVAHPWVLDPGDLPLF